MDIEQDGEIKSSNGHNLLLCSFCLAEDLQSHQAITVYLGYALCRVHLAQLLKKERGA